MKKITIWHTNDVHSRFEKFTELATFAADHKDPENDLFLDAGDFADTLSVMVSGTKGLGAVRLAKAAGIDAMAVGNNEFLAGIDVLRGMATYGVPMLACNITDLEGRPVEGLAPYMVLERAGVRILLIGCCPFFRHVSFFTDNAGVKLQDPVAALPKVVEEERKNCDICVLLSHGGRKRDLEIAEKIPGIDVIIGGHTHSVAQYTELSCGKIIHQADCYAQSLGKLELFLDEEKRITGFNSGELKVSCVPDAELSRVLSEETAKGETEFSRTLFTMSRELSYDPFGECPAVNVVADSLYELYGGEFAIINNGIIENGFSGDISRMFLLKTSPSILNPTTVWWRGRDIRKALLASFDREFISQEGKGPGSRFTVLGSLSVSHNVRVEYCPEKGPDLSAMLKVTVSGEPLEDGRLYCVTADDYMYRGVGGYTMLKGSEKPEIYYKGYIREMLERTLNDPEILRHADEKRIYITGRK